MRRRVLAGMLAAGAGLAAGGGTAWAGDGFADYAAVRGDFQRDRVITACRFTVEQLENARSVMTGEDEYSGLQGAIESEIVRQRTGGCPGGGGLEGAPVLSRARFVPATFRAARGSSLRFGLSRRATVRILLERRRGRRWTRLSTLVRSNRRAGDNAVPFRSRGLAPGAYRATLTAVAGRRRSAPRRATFRVRR